MWLDRYGCGCRSMPAISIYLPSPRPKETPEARDVAIRRIRGRKEASLERFLECLYISIRDDGHFTCLTDGTERGWGPRAGHTTTHPCFISCLSHMCMSRMSVCVWPHFRHINIGSRFQAEIPELQERSLAGMDEHVASLVWKPWGDVTTNPETQDRGG